MNDQERQKMQEAARKTVEMNRTLLNEVEQLLNDNKKLEEENQKWREHFEAGSAIYKQTQKSPVRSG
ncbi:hypothetical protein [Tuberibacillus sp. Marseille-P3662]|uniref:hypothetical protein n=1 Tax=Tuberibacillus sp. Marseille-P3662 TaxID=1965358 RepID=UPI000A1CD632|nr:hypothetical protein [Tuberibacillus sp. Marseille-P3662]